MTRSLLGRAAAAAFVCALTVAGLATPAWAADTGAITGRLVSATGSPVTSYVTLYDNNGDWADSTESDDTGEFRFTAVPAGTYKLKFDANGVQQWFRQKTDMDSADWVTVVAGQTATANDTQLPLGAITGRLVDSAGQPVPWVEVSALPPNHEGIWPYGYTDEDGRYRIELMPNSYKVQFRLPNGGEQWAPQKRQSDDAGMFTVSAGADTVVDETLLPFGSITGRVVDFSGEPIGGIQVTARDGEFQGGWAQTDEDGRYQMDTVFAGQYKVAFALPSSATVWAHGALAEDKATVFTVTAGEQTVVDEKLATGSVAGRFTKSDGTGLRGINVTVSRGEDIYLSTETDASGAYRLDYVPATDGYVVEFSDWENDLRQYAVGKTTKAEADRFRVTAGETATVNDSQLAGGELRIRATDKASGAPVSNFCAVLFGRSDLSECTKGTEIVFTGVSGGQYDGTLRPDDGGFYLDTSFDARVSPGETTRVSVPMVQGGAVTTVVTDAATGEPVADVCVSAHTMTTGSLGEGSGDCTDSQGKVRAGPIAPGTYTLFARAPNESSYGHQWVGATSGTGDQREAKKFTVRAGQVATGPAVRLDQAGTVSGAVTSAATGKPVESGYLSYSAWHFGAGPTNGTGIDDGKYELAGLGPYAWPLYVVSRGLAPQWSGGVGNRFKAVKVNVSAGETTTYDFALVTGSLLRGTVTPTSGTLSGARLTAHNVVTGDSIGVADASADGVYQMRVIGSQAVKIDYYWSTSDGEDRSHSGWYDGASDFAGATEVSVPGKGQKILDMTLR